jgi:hypothetical protein
MAPREAVDLSEKKSKPAAQARASQACEALLQKPVPRPGLAELASRLIEFPSARAAGVPRMAEDCWPRKEFQPAVSLYNSDTPSAQFGSVSLWHQQ